VPLQCLWFVLYVLKTSLLHSVLQLLVSLWDWPLIWLTNYCPSVLWHYCLGHVTCKIVLKMTCNVFSGTLNPTLLYYTTQPRKRVAKVKVWTLVIAPLTWVRLVTSSALQSHKWQLIGMSLWCRSALCGHPLPALTDNWTHGAVSRHTTASINHMRPSPCSRSYYSFPILLRVGGWVGLSTQYVSNLLRVKWRLLSVVLVVENA